MTIHNDAERKEEKQTQVLVVRSKMEPTRRLTTPTPTDTLIYKHTGAGLAFLQVKEQHFPGSERRHGHPTEVQTGAGGGGQGLKASLWSRRTSGFWVKPGVHVDGFRMGREGLRSAWYGQVFEGGGRGGPVSPFCELVKGTMRVVEGKLRG